MTLKLYFAFCWGALIALAITSSGSCLAEDNVSARQEFLQSQEKIIAMLPRIEAATVCLRAGGATGSGVVVSQDGLILTAAHVVDGNQVMEVVLNDGRTYSAKVLGIYLPSDAAMAQIIDKGPHAYVDIAPAKSLQVGQTIIAIGHPGGYDEQRGMPLRFGHITRFDRDFYVTECPLIGGDSGGPSFNLKGEMIGIHSNVASDLAVNNDVGIDTYHREWKSMLAGERRGTKLMEPEDPKIEASLRTRSEDQLHHKMISYAGEQDTLKSEIQSLWNDSQNKSGQLKIERAKLRQLREELGKRVEGLAPDGVRTLDDWTRRYQSAFSEQLSRCSEMVCPVYISGRQAAIATAVNERGYLVTKSSEVEGREIMLRPRGSEVPVKAEVVAHDRNLDLALLRVDPLVLPLKSIKFPVGNKLDASKGVLCCSISHSPDRAAGLGVVSVVSRPLTGDTTAYLGASFEVTDEGARVKTVMPNGPASRGGLAEGDILESIDSVEVTNSESIEKAVRSHLPGEKVSIGIRRGDRWLTLRVILDDKSKVAPMPGASEQNLDSQTTALSRRRWNFTRGIQHDGAVHPMNCGGPLIDLDGHVLGINIARAGRIHSYAIPTELVVDFVNKSLNESEAAR